LYRLFLNKFLPTAASLLFAFLILQVTGHAAENIPFAATQALESARLSQGLNLEVDPFPIETNLGGTAVLELSLENLSSSERKEIYIEGNVQETGWDSIAKLKVGGVKFHRFLCRIAWSGGCLDLTGIHLY